MQLEHVTFTPGFAWGALGPLAISFWDRPATTTHANDAVTLFRTVGREHEQVYVLTITGAHCLPMKTEVRDICAQEIRRRSKQIVASAHVVEGAGFQAAALRSVLVGMSLLVRMAGAEKICSHVHEAASFLERQSDGRLTSQSIAAAVDELRRGASSAK